MDRDQPQTRKEKKGDKYKAVFNQKTIRLKEAAQAAGAARATAQGKGKGKSPGSKWTARKERCSAFSCL